jgi:hypothetical protein
LRENRPEGKEAIVSASTVDLVDRAYRLRKARTKIDELIDLVEKDLIRRGRGDYTGTDPSKVAKVIIPSAPEPGYKLEASNEGAARKLAVGKFSDVFVRKVSYSPCKAFAAVCEKLFTPARCEKLLTLCRVDRATQSPYVKFE